MRVEQEPFVGDFVEGGGDPAVKEIDAWDLADDLNRFFECVLRSHIMFKNTRCHDI